MMKRLSLALVLSVAAVSASSVRIHIPLSGMTSHVPALDEHLRSAEIFDVATFPAATFQSTRVEKAPDGTLKVSGTLTLRGVSRPVVPAQE